ncbi:MAG: hypothetical protein ACXWFI_03320 [Methylobacter sp.]
MTEEKNSPKWSSVTAAVISLSIPFLYIFGYAYNQGYLQAYGVSNEFFARSLQEYLVFSFFACLSVFTSILEFFPNNIGLLSIFATIVGVIAFVGVAADKHCLNDRLQSKSARIKEHRLFDYIFFSLVPAGLAICAPYLLSVAIVLILLTPATAYKAGKRIAEQEITNAKTCIYSAPKEECVSLLEKGNPVASGKLVARSASHIALFNQGKTSIYPIKDQIVEVVVPTAKKPK